MASYRIAVVGEKDSVLGFQALGLDVFPAGGADQARTALHRLAKENYGNLSYRAARRPTGGGHRPI